MQLLFKKRQKIEIEICRFCLPTMAYSSDTANDVKKSFSLQAKYYVDGKEISEAATDVEKVNVNTGFFAKLKAFFRALFGRLPKVVQEYLGVEIIDRVIPD